VIAEGARIALAAVLLVGGLAKMVERGVGRGSIIAFGVPDRAARALGWVLIGGELAIATALLFGPTKIVGAAAALALLAIVSAVVAANMARGGNPECHCFGRLSRRPIGWPTLARNGLLGSIAGYAAVGGHEPALFAGLGFACGAAWFALSSLRPRVRRGAAAPTFSLTDAGGVRWTLQGMLAKGRPVLLVFSHPGCGACQALARDCGTAISGSATG
jgi:methylamine utilization protein MauE